MTQLTEKALGIAAKSVASGRHPDHARNKGQAKKRSDDGQYVYTPFMVGLRFTAHSQAIEESEGDLVRFDCDGSL